MKSIQRKFLIALITAIVFSTATYFIVNSQEKYYKSSIVVMNPAVSSSGSVLQSIIGSEVDSVAFIKSIIFSFDAKLKLLARDSFLGEDFSSELNRVGHDSLVEGFDDYIVLKQPYGSKNSIEIITTCVQPVRCRQRLETVIEFMDSESAEFLENYLKVSTEKHAIIARDQQLLRGSVSLRKRITDDYFNFAYNLNHLTVVKQPIEPIQPAGPRAKLAAVIAFVVIILFFILYGFYLYLASREQDK